MCICKYIVYKCIFIQIANNNSADDNVGNVLIFLFRFFFSCFFEGARPMGWQLVHALIITIIHPFWAPQSIFIFCGFFSSLLPCHSRSLGSGIVCVPFIFSFFTFMCGIFPVEALICLFLHFAESLRICQLVCMYVFVSMCLCLCWLLLFLFGFICCLYTAAEIILQ